MWRVCSRPPEEFGHHPGSGGNGQEALLRSSRWNSNNTILQSAVHDKEKAMSMAWKGIRIVIVNVCWGEGVMKSWVSPEAHGSWRCACLRDTHSLGAEVLG